MHIETTLSEVCYVVLGDGQRIKCANKQIAEKLVVILNRD